MDKKRMKSLIVACILLFVVQSCTIEKRMFNSGYHIEWKQRKSVVKSYEETAENSQNVRQEISESETQQLTEELKIVESVVETNAILDVSEEAIDKKAQTVVPTKDLNDSLKVKDKQTVVSDTPDPNRKLRDGIPVALRSAEIAGGSAGFLLLTGLLTLLSFYSSNLALFSIAFSLGIVGLGALIVGIICFFVSFKRKNELTSQELETYKLLKFFSGLVLSVFVVVYVKVIQFLTK